MAGLRVDHVNYLIWRYLQESGLGYAAVQLQRDWQLQDPQSLPFAHSIKPNELISILQDGLAYDEISSEVNSVDKRYAFREAQASSSAPAIAPEPVPTPPVDDAAEEEAAARSRKRPKLTGKKRTSSGRPPQQQSDDAMDVDSAEPTPPLKVEEPPILSTAEIGQDKSTQSEKAYEPLVAQTVAMFNLPKADVFNLCWPRLGGKEGLLATGGQISRTFEVLRDSDITADEQKDSGFWESVRSEALVSNATLDATRHKVALAASDTEEFHIVVASSPEGETAVLSAVAIGTGTVTVLKWSPAGERLAYACHSTTDHDPLSLSSHLGVVTTRTRTQSPLYPTGTPIEDAAWVDEHTLIICGDSKLELLSVRDDHIQSPRVLTTRFTWSSIRYDEHTKRAVCVSPEEGEIALLNITGTNFSFHVKSSHGSQITAVEWQPLSTTNALPELKDGEAMKDTQHPPSQRILATSSADGTIKIWNARNELQLLRTLTMDTFAPAMALAFSPDGKQIAAAGDGVVCIWLVDEGVQTANTPSRKDKPVAVWRQPSPAKQQSNGDAPHGAEPDDGFHVLVWSGTGEMIAYSSGDKIAVIAAPHASEPEHLTPAEPVSAHSAPEVAAMEMAMEIDAIP